MTDERRRDLEQIKAELEDLFDSLSEIHFEEDDYLDTLDIDSDEYDEVEEIVDELDDAVSNLEDAISGIAEALDRLS